MILSFQENIRLLRLIHSERLWSRYYREERKKSSYFVAYIVDSIAFIHMLTIGCIKLTFDKKQSQSYFEGAKKSKAKILFENMLWTFKYREVNHYYYAYGLDLKGSKPKDYCPNTAFRVMRNILNIRIHENKKNTVYCYNYLCLLRDKSLFALLCKSLNIPCPRTYALLSDGAVIFNDYRGGGANICLEALPVGFEAFCKETSGQLGKNAHIVKVKQEGIFLDGSHVSVDELKLYFAKGDYVFQEIITQHPVLACIYPNSVNTIRLITYIVDGKAMFYKSLLRIGAGGNHVDNFGQGGLAVAIDHHNGRIAQRALYKPGYGTFIDDYHPDTNAKYSEMKLPYYEEAVSQALRFHTFLQGFHMISWDIAITESGPVFVEANEDGEIEFFQVVYGGLREDTYEMHRQSMHVPLRKVR